MFKTARIVFLAGMTAASLAACTSESDKHESTHMAAHAASIPYPADLKPELSQNVGGIIDTGAQSLEVANFGTFVISDADIWINSSFCAHVDTIPPNGYIKVNFDQFYDSAGDALSQHEVRVNTVQIASKGKLWTLLGPINH